jgi:hypothetical protein
MEGLPQKGTSSSSREYINANQASGATRFMARPTRLGMTLQGAEAEEFCKNEASSEFTTEQIAFFRQAKKIYGANRSKF